MAHSAQALQKLNRFLANAITLDARKLAQQHYIMGEELLETEDIAAATATRALIAAVDAIGAVKFPDIWTNERDSAGADQDAA